MKVSLKFQKDFGCRQHLFPKNYYPSLSFPISPQVPDTLGPCATFSRKINMKCDMSLYGNFLFLISDYPWHFGDLWQYCCRIYPLKTRNAKCLQFTSGDIGLLRFNLCKCNTVIPYLLGQKWVPLGGFFMHTVCNSISALVTHAEISFHYKHFSGNNNS